MSEPTTLPVEPTPSDAQKPVRMPPYVVTPVGLPGKGDIKILSHITGEISAVTEARLATGHSFHVTLPLADWANDQKNKGGKLDMFSLIAYIDENIETWLKSHPSVVQQVQQAAAEIQAQISAAQAAHAAKQDNALPQADSQAATESQLS